MAKKTEVFINVQITDPELVEQLDAMVSAEDSDRSKFIRRLIRHEWTRREKKAHWVGNPEEPVAVELVADAVVS